MWSNKFLFCSRYCNAIHGNSEWWSLKSSWAGCECWEKSDSPAAYSMLISHTGEQYDILYFFFLIQIRGSVSFILLCIQYWKVQEAKQSKEGNCECSSNKIEKCLSAQSAFYQNLFFLVSPVYSTYAISPKMRCHIFTAALLLQTIEPNDIKSPVYIVVVARFMHCHELSSSQNPCDSRMCWWLLGLLTRHNMWNRWLWSCGWAYYSMLDSAVVAATLFL